MPEAVFTLHPGWLGLHLLLPLHSEHMLPKAECVIVSEQNTKTSQSGSTSEPKERAMRECLKSVSELI